MNKILSNSIRLSVAIAWLFATQEAYSQLVLTNTEINIKFYNQAGFTVKFQIVYSVDPPGIEKQEHVVISTQNLSIGQSETITLPRYACIKELKGQALDATGKPDKLVFSKTYKTSDNNKVPRCFKTYGTSTNPQWNNNCN